MTSTQYSMLGSVQWFVVHFIITLVLILVWPGSMMPNAFIGPIQSAFFWLIYLAGSIMGWIVILQEDIKLPYLIGKPKYEKDDE